MPFVLFFVPCEDGGKKRKMNTVSFALNIQVEQRDKRAILLFVSVLCIKVVVQPTEKQLWFAVEPLGYIRNFYWQVWIVLSLSLPQ